MAKSKVAKAASLLSKRGTRARKKQLEAMTPQARSEMMSRVARARWANKLGTSGDGAAADATRFESGTAD